ncbi:hypothetical protein PWT90_10859 [Aphanocladium album]|nr:hypothetical protein PWT90_10859 [Aphanocladium album]
MLWRLVFAVLLVQQFSPRAQSHTEAQFIQGYIANPNQLGYNDYFYVPNQGDTAIPVVVPRPDVFYLEYNCYYMKEICKNAENFLASPRGSAYRNGNAFGYDFNTGRKGRSSKRRKQACPTGNKGWITYHPCPEADQQLPMRNDGQWPYSGLDPFATDKKTIKHVRDLKGKILLHSYMKYSCDEFPPATWVEGGNGSSVAGNSNGGDSHTRCAAIRCAKGINAEQNWQGAAHGRLRETLKDYVDNMNKANRQHPPYPFFNPKDGVVAFFFRMKNAPDRIAARVYHYADSSLQIPQGLLGIPLKKRHEEQNRFMEWARTVRTEDLVKTGKVTIHNIFANQTEFAVSEMSSEYDDDDPEVADEDLHQNTGEAVDAHAITLKHSSHAAGSSLSTDAANGAFGGNVKKLHSRNDTLLSLNSTLAFGNTTSELERARQIVRVAMERSIELNRARLAKPRRNLYGAKHGSATALEKRAILADQAEIRPLLLLTDDIVDAAALVSEADALHLSSNVTRRDHPAGSYWMEHIDRKGTVPWGNDASYKVFRNVRDFGAVGDGKTDDTKAIKRAMNDGRRCGERCNGSTTKNAIVYFPPGSYRVSSSIPLPFGTQVIGDSANWPTIVAAPGFIGLGVLSTDEYTGGGVGIDGGDQEWFVNTANFYRQIRNLRIDISATRAEQQVACLHYQVAQATSIQNVELIAAAGSGHGIFAENGSGGVMSDITFRGGKFGIYSGTQQFTAQRMTFDGCETGVQIIWDWGWVWKSISMKNVQVGFRLLQEANSGGHVGSASVMDSSFQDVGTAILVAPLSPKPGSGSTGVIVDNVKFSGVTKAVADTSGAVLLAPSGTVDHWAVGPVYSSDGTREFSTRQSPGNGYTRQASLVDGSGTYFERPKPQYEGSSASEFLHVKDFGARGDGATDDTAAFQAAVYASQGKILFVDAGSYILTATITIPIGSRIVGETWSQLVASGSYFADPNHPKVLVKVGSDGDEGTIEMQDLLFTNRGPTAGLILVEWNVKASQPGAAALWDCHVRIGGATGTQLTPQECPPSTSGINGGCQAASLMMHITPKASGYFENMWLWVADHMIDDPDLNDAGNDMVQTSIYVARGLLIESTSPVWLYGTASEHSIFYQYNFHNSHNVFAAMIQTESPYYQPTPPPPAPFNSQVGLLPGDPEFNCGKDQAELGGCDESWAVIVRGSSNILIAGAGLYSWFSTYSQDCIDKHACQKVMMLLENNDYNVRFQQLITIGAEYMAVQNGRGILATDNLNVDTHPRWSQISVFDVSTKYSKSVNDAWFHPQIWDNKTAGFTCTAPCTAVLPPWTSATAIVDCPLVTVSQGTWTSTITRPPMTISEWVLQKITVGAHDLVVRGVDSVVPVTPTIEPTKTWPAITYMGPDSQMSTITPAPKTPVGIPTDKAPSWGKWPDEPIMVTMHPSDKGPLARECSYLNQQGYCDRNQDFWDVFLGILVPGWKEWYYDETAPEDRGGCAPMPEEETSTPTPAPTSTRPPLAHPSPLENKVGCWNFGDKLNHFEMDNGIAEFCKHAVGGGAVLKPDFMLSRVQLVRPPSPEIGEPGKAVTFSLNVHSDCDWEATSDECRRYFLADVDGCNCGGVNGKQGGLVSNNCLSVGIWPGANMQDVVHDEL